MLKKKIQRPRLITLFLRYIFYFLFEKTFWCDKVKIFLIFNFLNIL
jgi:hypothetical protein